MTDQQLLQEIVATNCRHININQPVIFDYWNDRSKLNERSTQELMHKFLLHKIKRLYISNSKLEEYDSIVSMYRKLRETLVSQDSYDSFSFKVYQVSFDVTLLTCNHGELFKSIKGLVENFYGLKTIESALYLRYFKYYMLYLCCYLDTSESRRTILGCLQIITDNERGSNEVKRALAVFQCLQTGNYIQWNKLRLESDIYEGKFFQMAETWFQDRILFAISKSYLHLPYSYIASIFNMEEEYLKQFLQNFGLNIVNNTVHFRKNRK